MSGVYQLVALLGPGGGQRPALPALAPRPYGGAFHLVRRLTKLSSRLTKLVQP